MAATEPNETAIFAPILRSKRLTMTLLSFDNLNDTEYLNHVAALRVEVHADKTPMTIDGFKERWEKTLLHPSWCCGLNPPGPGIYIVHFSKNDPTGPIIGIVTLNQRREDVPPDIGFAFSKEYRGKGYATEATKEVVDYWRLDFGVPGLSLFTDDENKSATKLAERVGFIRQKTTIKNTEGTDLTVYLTPGTDPLPDGTIVAI